MTGSPSSVPSADAARPEASAPFDLERLQRELGTVRLGRRVDYRTETGSTNTDAFELGRAGAPDGTVVLAEAQTHGRGRLGRSWSSPPFRNLYLSVLVRADLAAAEAPLLGLLTGSAVARTIRESCPRASLKWPNDVLIDGRKVCGILTEMEASGDRLRFAILGIGVNLNMADDDFPPELRPRALGLATATGTAIDRTAFLARLLLHLEQRIDRFLKEGFGPLRAEWESLSDFFGREVEIDDSGRRWRGEALGLAEDGTLRLRRSDGGEDRIVAGDVTVIGTHAARG